MGWTAHRVLTQVVTVGGKGVAGMVKKAICAADVLCLLIAAEDMDPELYEEVLDTLAQIQPQQAESLLEQLTDETYGTYEPQAFEAAVLVLQQTSWFQE